MNTGKTQAIWPKNFTNNNYYLPKDYQKLRKSVLFAFPEHEFRNNSAIDSEDQNDFYWSSLEN